MPAIKAGELAAWLMRAIEDDPEVASLPVVGFYDDGFAWSDVEDPEVRAYPKGTGRIVALTVITR